MSKKVTLFGALALLLIIAAALIVSLGPYDFRTEHHHDESGMTLASSAFAEGETIPVKYTCDGEDISPPLMWEDVPVETKAFALICSDPDAPVGTWDHWILYNIPVEVTSLPAGQAADSVLFGRALRGLNSWRRTNYGGPCPPPGKPHRYEFRLYALYAPIELPTGATREQLLEAMEGLVVASDNLTGIYGR